jgi:hypothetical protein
MNIEESRKLLQQAGVFYCNSEFELDGEDSSNLQTLNMNDVWAWATAWGEYISNEELPEVAELFCSFGFAGILYWMSEKYDKMQSEFHHFNRMIEFVRKEKEIKVEFGDKYIFGKISYTIGE